MGKNLISYFFITIHPQIISQYSALGVFLRAQKSAAASFAAINLRDFALDSRGSVDDRPYGGGDGMVLRPDILLRARESISAPCQVIYTSPGGKPWQQQDAERFASAKTSVVFICGRFGGVDQRFLERCVDAEFRLGDAVFAGGELPSLLICESILRLLPGVLGNDESAQSDSFSSKLNGKIEHPLYTRPEDFLGEKIPEVLVSGDHQAIATWRKNKQFVKKF